MGDTWQVNAGRSRFSKALPTPPPNPSYEDEGRRGKANPFPSVQRALPSAPKSNIASTISRRPVGNQTNSKATSTASASPIYSESPKMLPNYEAFVKKLESMETKEAERTPPPPPKDKGKHPLPDIPQEPTHLHSNSNSSTTSSANGSSPRSEIWRRRSVKSDRSGSITELKLTKSNGFTANPPSVNPTSPLTVDKHSLPPLPLQPARPVGLPGRDIKPARPAPPQPDAMGSKVSKVLKAESKAPLPSGDATNFSGRSADYQPSPIKRLPTPDYQSTDTRFQQPPASQVLSVVSPETPPSDLSPELGHDQAFGDHTSGSRLPKPRNDLKLLPSVRASEPVETVTREPSPPRSAQPQKLELPSILAIKRPPSPSPKPEVPSPEAASPGTPDCFPPAALSTIHFDCYQSHRQMKVSRNDVCPVACMVCEVKDTEKRWMCTWCSLRCCDPCMKGLANVPGKDLRKCLEWIGRKDRISNSEASPDT